MADDDYDFIPEFPPKARQLPSAHTVADMSPLVSTFPPLGQVTRLGSDYVVFHALLEVNETENDQDWDIALWHSTGASEWTESPMSVLPGDKAFTSMQIGEPHKRRYLFQATVQVISPLHFTLKFRKRADTSWTWIREQQGVMDGVVIVALEVPRGSARDDLSDIIHGLNPNLKVKSAVSQTPRTELWVVETTIGPAHGEHSAFTDVEMGKPWGQYFR
jgi:hypothetical protein